ncbi:MAG: hypothetical protein ACRD3W_10390, partial [Terriglobales bacterium]
MSNIEQFLPPDPRFGKPIGQTEQQAMTRSQADTQAYSQMLDETMSPVLQAFRNVTSFTERLNDGCTTIASGIFGDGIARQHASVLNDQANECLSHGHVAAAEHILRRNLQFSVGALGLDADETVNAAQQL